MRRIAMVLMIALLAAGCGGDDGGTDPADPATDGETTAEGVQPSGDAVDAGCPAQGFVGDISRVAGGGHAEAMISTDDVVVDEVIAARLSAGSFYTIYVADHEFTGDPRAFETVEAAPGGVVATLSLGRQGGYFKGEPFGPADEGATVAVIVDSGGGASTSSMNPEGTVVPLGWSDDWVCVEIDYTDDFQSVTGTVSAPVVAGF